MENYAEYLEGLISRTYECSFVRKLSKTEWEMAYEIAKMRDEPIINVLFRFGLVNVEMEEEET